VGLPAGVDFAAALGERGTICVRYAGVPVCCDPAVPVRICGWDGFCIPVAASPSRVQMLQIVRENRTIAVLSVQEFLLDFTPHMLRTAAQNILAKLFQICGVI
jgi:hypothetical protein